MARAEARRVTVHYYRGKPEGMAEASLWERVEEAKASDSRELQSTVLAGAVIGSFSWEPVSDAYWLAPAAWYCSLVFSILGILLAAQLVAVLNLLGSIPRDPESPAALKTAERYLPLLVSGSRVLSEMHQGPQRGDDSSYAPVTPRWHMVFAWQCPVMFMSYSVCTFLLGLTVLVITPLLRLGGREWDGNATVAVIYAVMLATAGTMFVFCTFWIYHYVQIDTETFLDNDEDIGMEDSPAGVSAGGRYSIAPFSTSVGTQSPSAPIHRAGRRPASPSQLSPASYSPAEEKASAQWQEWPRAH